MHRIIATSNTLMSLKYISLRSSLVYFPGRGGTEIRTYYFTGNIPLQGATWIFVEKTSLKVTIESIKYISALPPHLRMLLMHDI
jgi:hypothetical protein